jgi:hypothetical protein
VGSPPDSRLMRCAHAGLGEVHLPPPDSMSGTVKTDWVGCAGVFPRLYVEKPSARIFRAMKSPTAGLLCSIAP